MTCNTPLYDRHLVDGNSCTASIEHCRTHNGPLMTYGYCASSLTRLVSIKKDFCLTKLPITILMQMAMWRSKSIIAKMYWFWVSWPALSHRLTIITIVCSIKCNPSIILADIANICFIQREITLFWNLHRGYSLSTVFYNHWVVRRVWYRTLTRYINSFHLLSRITFILYLSAVEIYQQLPC
jgi:hypothetical protein